MYNRIEDTPRVRDGRTHYPERPTPSERFPGEGVLIDLAGADDEDLQLIVARFAALRSWSLAGDGPVCAHAASAARAHLDAVDPGWVEGGLLRRLVDGSGPAIRLLEAAADRAASRGHVAGARALRQAAHRLRWRATGFSSPSIS